jgi:hypothetical protein
LGVGQREAVEPEDVQPSPLSLPETLKPKDGKVGGTTLFKDPNVSISDNQSKSKKQLTQECENESESEIGVQDTPVKVKAFWDSSPEESPGKLDKTGTGASPIEYYYSDPPKGGVDQATQTPSSLPTFPSFIFQGEQVEGREKLTGLDYKDFETEKEIQSVSGESIGSNKTFIDWLNTVDLDSFNPDPSPTCFDWLDPSDLGELFAEMVTQQQFDTVRNALAQVQEELEAKKSGGVLRVYKGTSWEDPQAWWRKFRNHLQVKKITDLKTQWGELHAYLEDAAESWFHDLPEPKYGPAIDGQPGALLPDQPWSSLDNLEKEFLNQFGKRESSYPGMVAFEARVLGKNEKIKDYLDDIRKQGARLGKSATDVQNAMIRGLPSAMKNFVWQQAPKTMAETIEKIEIAELTIPNCRGEGVGSAFAATPSLAAMEVEYEVPQVYTATNANHKAKPKKSGGKKEKKENKEEIQIQQVLNAVQALEDRVAKPGKWGSQGQNNNRGGRGRGIQRGRPQRNGACFNCGIVGHFARECYRSPNNQGYNQGYNPYATEFYPQGTQNEFQSQGNSRGYGRGRGGFHRGGWNNSYSNQRSSSQEN